MSLQRQFATHSPPSPPSLQKQPGAQQSRAWPRFSLLSLAGAVALVIGAIAAAILAMPGWPGTAHQPGTSTHRPAAVPPTRSQSSPPGGAGMRPATAAVSAPASSAPGSSLGPASRVPSLIHKAVIPSPLKHQTPPAAGKTAQPSSPGLTPPALPTPIYPSSMPSPTTGPPTSSPPGTPTASLSSLSRARSSAASGAPRSE